MEDAGESGVTSEDRSLISRDGREAHKIGELVEVT